MGRWMRLHGGPPACQQHGSLCCDVQDLPDHLSGLSLDYARCNFTWQDVSVTLHLVTQWSLGALDAGLARTFCILLNRGPWDRMWPSGAWAPLFLWFEVLLCRPPVGDTCRNF